MLNEILNLLSTLIIINKNVVFNYLLDRHKYYQEHQQNIHTEPVDNYKIILLFKHIKLIN